MGSPVSLEQVIERDDVRGLGGSCEFPVGQEERRQIGAIRQLESSAFDELDVLLQASGNSVRLMTILRVEGPFVSPATVSEGDLERAILRVFFKPGHAT